jgi:LemA protein
LHHELYVIGRSQLDEEATAPLIAHDPESPLFVISTQGEESVSKGYVWGLRGWTLLALLTNFGAVFTLFASMAELDGPRLDPAGADLPLFVTVSVLLFVLVWTLCWIWQVYNALVGLRQRSLRGDSLIDIELERRSDLIPRLVEIVKAMADHEQETQAALARMRSQADLRMVVERHPDLKSNQLFSDLQDRLVDTEDRIARARAYANELGANYNTRLEVVPDRWVAALAKLRPRPMFAVDAFERRAVTVDLAD